MPKKQPVAVQIVEHQHRAAEALVGLVDGQITPKRGVSLFLDSTAFMMAHESRASSQGIDAFGFRRASVSGAMDTPPAFRSRRSSIPLAPGSTISASSANRGAPVEIAKEAEPGSKIQPHRLVGLESLDEMFKVVGDHVASCTLAATCDRAIVQKGEQISGSMSQLELACGGCDQRFNFHLTKTRGQPNRDGKPGPKKGEVNILLALGTIRCGLGRTGLSNVLSTVGVPVLSASPWQNVIEEMEGCLDDLSKLSEAAAIQDEVDLTTVYLKHTPLSKSVLGPGPVKAVAYVPSHSSDRFVFLSLGNKQTNKQNACKVFSFADGWLHFIFMF
jgi:hypothetical protein